MTEQPRSHNTSSPLFLLLAPQSAHTPLEAPDEYLDMFADISDHNRRVFGAMVAALDVMVGRVIEALRESHLYENSLIVFVSDNGAAPKQVIASQGSQVIKNLSTEYVGPAKDIRLPTSSHSGREQLASERSEDHCLGGRYCDLTILFCVSVG